MSPLVRALLFVAVLIGLIAGLSVMFGDFGWYEDLDEEYDYYWELTEYIRTDGAINIGSEGWASTLVALGLLLIACSVIALLIWMRPASSSGWLGIIGAVLALVALVGLLVAGAAFDEEMEKEEYADWNWDFGFYMGMVGSLILMGLMICVVLMPAQSQPQAPPPPPPF